MLRAELEDTQFSILHSAFSTCRRHRSPYGVWVASAKVPENGCEYRMGIVQDGGTDAAWEQYSMEWDKSKADFGLGWREMPVRTSRCGGVFPGLWRVGRTEGQIMVDKSAGLWL